MKVRFRWLAFSILFLTLAQATKAQKATETTQTVYQLLDEYSPESAALIRLLYQLPSSFGPKNNPLMFGFLTNQKKGLSLL
jgi:hypothetical protein